MYELYIFFVPGVVQRLQEYYRTPTHGVAKAWLCTVVDHYAGSYGDKGWGCGYRNFQMLLSSLMTEPTYNKVLFNGWFFLLIKYLVIKLTCAIYVYV
jgi:hypothetical protein